MLRIQPDGYGVYYEMEEDLKPIIEWDYSSHLTEGEKLPFPPKSEKSQLLLF